MLSVGDIIKTARISCGMTQEELAAKVGVQKSAIAKWENGRVSEIKRSNLKRLADALGIRPVVLLGDIEADPVSAADFVAKVLQDKQVMELIEDYVKLSDSNQKIVLDLVKSLPKVI